MKSILFGSITFLVWSGLSTYYYVCQIKGLCVDNPDAITEVVNPAPSEEDGSEAIPIAEPIPEPEVEPEIMKPSAFTIHHAYNRQNFIADKQFDDYLAELKAFLSDHDDATITLIGYSDSIGNEEYNYNLGLSRASFLKNYMIKNGFQSQLIEINSKGEDSPINSNATSQGRAQNRRTVIQIN